MISRSAVCHSEPWMPTVARWIANTFRLTSRKSLIAIAGVIAIDLPVLFATREELIGWVLIGAWGEGEGFETVGIILIFWLGWFQLWLVYDESNYRVGIKSLPSCFLKDLKVSKEKGPPAPAPAPASQGSNPIFHFRVQTRNPDWIHHQSRRRESDENHIQNRHIINNINIINNNNNNNNNNKTAADIKTKNNLLLLFCFHK